MTLHEEAVLAGLRSKQTGMPVEPIRRNPEFASDLQPSQEQYLHYIAILFSQTFNLQSDRRINELTDSIWAGQEMCVYLKNGVKSVQEKADDEPRRLSECGSSSELRYRSF